MNTCQQCRSLVPLKAEYCSFCGALQRPLQKKVPARLPQSFRQWQQQMEAALKQYQPEVDRTRINPEKERKAWQLKVSPEEFAQQDDLPHKSPKPQIFQPYVPQSAAVQNDPKYQLNTGLGRCPLCGSSNIGLVPKQTGGYFGSAQFVMFMLAYEQWYQNKQPQQYQCAYCHHVFL